MKKLTVIVKPANREDVIDIMESCTQFRKPLREQMY